MTLSRAVVVSAAFALVFVGCAPTPCERSVKAAKTNQGDCGDEIAGSLLGNACSANLSSCTGDDQKLMDTALTCVEKMSACSSISKDAWRLQRDTCAAGLENLSPTCKSLFMNAVPVIDAGTPDAGPQAINDGGNGLTLVGAANADTVALAWDTRRTAMVEKWMLIESDALGDNRTERILDMTPGSSVNVTIGDAGMSGRRYYVAGLNQAGDVLFGTAIEEMMMVVDAGNSCAGPDNCPDDRVCDLGQCRQQTCPFQMMNTCPGGYSCFAPGECRRTSADGGVFMGGGMRRDAGTAPLAMISNEIGLTPRPPLLPPTVVVGSVAAKRPDIAAYDTARVSLSLEQEGQLIAHPSALRGADFIDEAVTSFSLDTTGVRAHLAWNPDSKALYACYVVGRGVRVQKSIDRGETWGRAVTTFEPPLPDDGGVGEIIRDCDIAPWKNGGALMVTAENEALIIRELTETLTVSMTGPAFTSTPPDAGVTAVFAPSHPAIATLPSTGVVHVTFTGTRLLTGGASDSEPYGVYREGTGSFTPAARMTPSASPSALPEDWTTVSVNPKTGRAVGAFTSILPGNQSSTVYVALFNTVTRGWGTGSHLNVFVTDQNTSVWLPQKAPTDTWFAFSPQFAPLPDGTFAFSFVAGPHSGSSGDYRMYMVPFDLDRVPSITNGRGWFVPPVVKMSDDRVLDPRGSMAAPQPPVTALTADNQISVYGVFIGGSGINGDVEGPARFFSWP
jgi:hypothetical protein